MPGLARDELRGSVTGWWRVWRRELDRRGAAARHAREVAKHQRALRAAQRWTVRYSAAAAAALVGVPTTHGWAQLCWGGTSALFATFAGFSAVEARHRRRTPLPSGPMLPPAIPPPPPMGSRAWPALRRIDVARGALRRAASSAPRPLRATLAPALDAAAATDDAARLHAGQLAALEAALRPASTTAAEAADLRAHIARQLTELDRAAGALEALATAAARLVGGAAGGPGMSDALRAATDEAVAVAYGLRVAASIDDRAAGVEG